LLVANKRLDQSQEHLFTLATATKFLTAELLHTREGRQQLSEALYTYLKPHKHQVPSHKPQYNPKREEATHKTEAVSHLEIVARGRSSLCGSDCLCNCHSQRQQKHVRQQLLGNFVGFLGSLFVGYTGLPVSRTRCDVSNCFENKTTNVEVTYLFPSWLLHYAIFISYEKHITGLPKFGIVFQQRVNIDTGGIIYAAQQNDVSRLRLCISRCLDSVNHAYIHDGRTALSFAVQCGNIEAIRTLLQYGANPDICEDSGQTPGCCAALFYLEKRYPEDVAQKLTFYLPISKYIDDFNMSPLSEIVVGRRFGSLSQVLEKAGPDFDINQRDDSGRTALYWAVRCKDPEAVEELLQLGADVDYPDVGHRTPLFASVVAKDVNCFNILLRHGANIHHCSGAGIYLIHIACHLGFLIVVKKMVRLGVDVNLETVGALMTPLSYAVQYDSFEVAKFLVDKGADVDHNSLDGTSILEDAISRNSHNCIKLLLEYSADYGYINATTGQSILHFLASTADPITIRIFEDHRMQLNDEALVMKDNDGRTPERVFTQRLDVTQELRDAFERLLVSISKANSSYEGEKENDSSEDEIENEFYNAVESLSLE
jgi:ankyrin repeat protein